MGRRKTVLACYVWVFLLLVTVMSVILNIAPVASTPDIIKVPQHYSKIQEAIDASSPGDTIVVSPGTYDEQVVVYQKKNLTLVVEDLSDPAVIQGKENGTVLRVLASNNITIRGFIIRGTGYETYPRPSPLIQISPSPGVGVLAENTNEVILENNTITKNLYGVRVYWSERVTMKNNNITDNIYNFGVEGFHLSDFLHDIDTSNFVNERRIYYLVNQYGLIIDSVVTPEIGYIAIINSGNTTVKNLDVSNNFQGVLLAYTTNSTVQNVNASDNIWGIELVDSMNNTIKDNKMSDNGIGLFSLGYGGGKPPALHNNFVSANEATNNVVGMALSYSGGNTLRLNNMTSNFFNFGVFGSSSDYVQDIDTSNTVNGKPIYYWVDQHHRQVPSDAGYVAAVDSTDIIVKDLILSNNLQGVLLANTASSLIENVVTTDNYFGVHFSTARAFPQASLSGNTISQSIISKNWQGIWFVEGSNNNTIIGNTITSNYGFGIWLWEGATNNTISNNTISNNTRGIWLDEGGGGNYIIRNTISENKEGIVVESWAQPSTVYHNNFINNTKQVSIFGAPPSPDPSIWDDGYPSGGNYWSDYNGTDEFKGSFQNITGNDGIGDTPYLIDAYNRDRYPLMKSWTPTPPTPDFSISASPTSLTIQLGGSDTSVITIASISGFDQLVQLALSGAPAGVTTALNPEQVTPPPYGSTTSTLTVSVATTATPGSYSLTVTGTSGTITHSVDISLEITTMPPPADTTPPVTTISLSGASGNNDWFTSDVTITLSATDNVKVEKTEYSFDTVTWIAYTTPFTITTEGANIVYYKSTDKAGNPETTKAKTIKIDRTTPSGSITINHGATYTNSSLVTLTLSADDVISDVAQMRFSHDNLTWTPWEAYSTSKAWTLTANDGTKTVFVQYMDNAGLISQSYQNTITSDTTKPTANAGQDRRVAVGSILNFDASASSDNTDITNYEWNFGDGTTGSGKTTTHTYTSPGIYTVTLTVKDAAGNSATHSITITVLAAEAFPMWIIGVIIVVTGIAVAATLLLRKRKQLKH